MKTRHAQRWILVGVLLFAWAWRLSGLDYQSLWRDEMDSLIFATRPLAQALRMFLRPGENGPLYFLALRPWLMVMGHSEFALRFPSAWMGVLALPLLFVWGRKLFGVKVGAVAMLLLAVNPYHVWYSQEAKMYSLLVVLVLLALWMFMQALERGGWWRWLLWWALTSVCFYVHVLAVLVIPLQFLWFLFTRRWHVRWRSYALALLALIGPYIPLVWWQWKLFINPDFRTGHPFVPLLRMLQILFVAQVQGIPSRSGVWAFAPVFFLMLAALLLPANRKRQRGLLAVWWFFPPLALFLISLRIPIFTERYLIWILPAFLLWLAVGWAATWQMQRVVAVLVLGLLLVFQIGVGWQQSHRPIKSDFRAAAAYVRQQRQDGDILVFLMPYIRPTYRYYDPGPYPWFDAPYANRAPDAENLPSRLQSGVEGYDGVWLIESESELYDAQGLLRQWLETHATRDAEAHFTRVDVIHYRLSR